MWARLLEYLSAGWVDQFVAKRGLLASGRPIERLLNGADGRRRFLHVGCGPLRKAKTVPGFTTDEWVEIRVDIDPAVEPDLVASMTSMACLPDESVDAIFSSHNVEHLYAHEVPIALAEFYRVLKPDGFLLLTGPDLQSVCRMVADDRLDELAYQSAAGPIAPIDILYGHRSTMSAGNLFMSHRYGFTLRTLVQAAQDAGFQGCYGQRRDASFDLWLLAAKQALTKEQLADKARGFVPTPEQL